jgi:hypothetical protein
MKQSGMQTAELAAHFIMQHWLWVLLGKRTRYFFISSSTKSAHIWLPKMTSVCYLSLWLELYSTGLAISTTVQYILFPYSLNRSCKLQKQKSDVLSCICVYIQTSSRMTSIMLVICPRGNYNNLD